MQDRVQGKADCHMLSVIRVREKCKGFLKVEEKDLKTESMEIRAFASWLYLLSFTHIHDGNE